MLSVLFLEVSATPLPIDVTHVPPPDFVAWAALIVSTMLALVTGGLFWVTRNMATETHRLADKTAEMAKETAELARDTVQATKVADRHHQESMSPVCVLKDVTCTLGAQGDGADTIKLSFSVENQGTGPATEVTATIAPHDAVNNPCEKFIRKNIGPLKAGEVTRKPIGPELSSVLQMDHFIVTLDYETVFETTGSSVWKIRYTSPTVPSPCSLVRQTLPVTKDRVSQKPRVLEGESEAKTRS